MIVFALTLLVFSTFLASVFLVELAQKRSRNRRLAVPRAMLPSRSGQPVVVKAR